MKKFCIAVFTLTVLALGCALAQAGEIVTIRGIENGHCYMTLMNTETGVTSKIRREIESNPSRLSLPDGHRMTFLTVYSKYNGGDREVGENEGPNPIYQTTLLPRHQMRIDYVGNGPGEVSPN